MAKWVIEFLENPYQSRYYQFIKSKGEYMTNRRFRFISVLLAVIMLAAVSCASSGQAAETILLDQAVQKAAENIENMLPQGVKIALLNFSSSSAALSEYVLEELSGYLVNGGKLVVVDRKELDLIRQEERFQLSGEVSDESAQSIGKKLGAQVIVSGSLIDVGKNYRFRVKTLTVETAAIATTASSYINTKEDKVVYLLSGAGKSVTAPPENSGNDTESDIVFDNNGTITEYRGTNVNVIIPAKIKEVSITTIGIQAFYKKGLKSVTLPVSITFISEDAFAFNQLTNVTIPDNVSVIGNFAFSNNQLASVAIGSGVTSIYADAFRENKLTNVTIPPGVTSIGRAAFAANPLSSVTIGAGVAVSDGNGFDVSYNTNGRKAGTYMYSSGEWVIR